jgi:hypothetical protein
MLGEMLADRFKAYSRAGYSALPWPSAANSNGEISMAPSAARVKREQG